MLFVKSSVRHHNVTLFFHYEVNVESLGLNSLEPALLLENLKLFLLSHSLDCLIWPLHFH